MDLLQEFCRQIGFYIGDLDSEVHDIDSKADYKDFVSVDGEEGDYGIVRYYDKTNNQLLAVRTIHGGDSEDTEFTQYGASLLQDKALHLMREKFKNINFTD